MELIIILHPHICSATSNLKIKLDAPIEMRQNILSEKNRKGLLAMADIMSDFNQPWTDRAYPTRDKLGRMKV
jgi:hypothetical protein